MIHKVENQQQFREGIREKLINRLLVCKVPKKHLIKI